MLCGFEHPCWREKSCPLQRLTAKEAFCNTADCSCNLKISQNTELKVWRRCASRKSQVEDEIGESSRLFEVTMEDSVRVEVATVSSGEGVSGASSELPRNELNSGQR